MKQRDSPFCHICCHEDSFLFVERRFWVFLLSILLLATDFRSLTWIVGFLGRIRIHLFNKGASVWVRCCHSDGSPGGSVSVKGGGGGDPARVCSTHRPHPVDLDSASTHIGECCRYLGT